MLIITCPCDHEWIVSTAPGFNWARALSADPCPACGRDAGGRMGNTVDDPSIGEVFGGMSATNLQPCSVLSWSVMEPRNNPKLALITMHIEGKGGRVELIGEVDRSRDIITKAWFARVSPVKTNMQRLPVAGLVGQVADLMLSIGMDEKPVDDWQQFAERAVAVFRGPQDRS